MTTGADLCARLREAGEKGAVASTISYFSSVESNTKQVRKQLSVWTEAFAAGGRRMGCGVLFVCLGKVCRETGRLGPVSTIAAPIVVLTRGGCLLRTR